MRARGNKMRNEVSTKKVTEKEAELLVTTRPGAHRNLWRKNKNSKRLTSLSVSAWLD